MASGNQFHTYQKQRSQNYLYIDRVVKNHIEMGGGLFHVYPLIGAIKEDGTVVEVGSENAVVSDPVFNENSRRKYSHVTYDLYDFIKMNTPQFSFSFSGLSLLDTDEKEVSWHYNSMVAQLGRKLIVGDVIEISWMRDLDILGRDTASNKFYVITESARDENGWAPNYKYHLWKTKMKPITDSPEYADLFQPSDDPDDPFYVEPGSPEGGGGLDPSNKQDDNLNDLNNEILDEAEGEDGNPENGWMTSGVSFRLHDEHHVYLDKNMVLYVDNKPNIVGIDGIPAEETCVDVPFGENFPDSKTVQEGDYFLRIDFTVPKLFRRVNDNGRAGWALIENDWREKWTGMPMMLRKFVNNEYSFTTDSGRELTMKQNIKDLVKARVKKEHNNPRPWNKEIADEIGSDTIIGIEKPYKEEDE